MENKDVYYTVKLWHFDGDCRYEMKSYNFSKRDKAEKELKKCNKVAEDENKVGEMKSYYCSIYEEPYKVKMSDDEEIDWKVY